MIFASPYADVDIPEMPLTSYIFQKNAHLTDKIALIDGSSGRAISYSELRNRVYRVANGLAKMGLKKGDVFAIYSPNIPEYAIILNAIALNGGINTLINPLYTVDELKKQLVDSAAKYLIPISLFLEKVQEATRDLNIQLYVFDEASECPTLKSLVDVNNQPPEVEINPKKDIVALPYSSGTTGLPKGVMLTHYNLVANMCQLVGVTGQRQISQEDNVVGILPFFHIYGFLIILNFSLSRGATIVTMPRFAMEPFLHILQKYKITIAHLVPPIILGLDKLPNFEQLDASSLERIRSGAAPLSPALAKSVSRKLSCSVIQGYGLNETSPVTHILPDTPNATKLASVGPSIPNTEVKIVDIETNAELNANEKGEILIRGPQVMKGYLNNPQETKLMIDKDGWLSTGDIGFVDDAGFLFIVDRKKELIKYKGYQVAPAELEGLLISHPNIADAAVIGSPDPECGEAPKAFVVLKQEVSPADILTFINNKVAPYKKIRKIEIINQIPRSIAGKILRRVLIDQEKKQTCQ